MDASLANISVEIPRDDMSLMEVIAQRMGWKVKINESSNISNGKGSINISLKEAQNGETVCFDTVEDLMKDLLS
jgi:hypothetical protein